MQPAEHVEEMRVRTGHLRQVLPHPHHPQRRRAVVWQPARPCEHSGAPDVTGDTLRNRRTARVRRQDARTTHPAGAVRDDQRVAEHREAQPELVSAAPVELSQRTPHRLAHRIPQALRLELRPTRTRSIERILALRQRAQPEFVIENCRLAARRPHIDPDQIVHRRALPPARTSCEHSSVPAAPGWCRSAGVRYLTVAIRPIVSKYFPSSASIMAMSRCA